MGGYCCDQRKVTGHFRQTCFVFCFWVDEKAQWLELFEDEAEAFRAGCVRFGGWKQENLHRPSTHLQIINWTVDGVTLMRTKESGGHQIGDVQLENPDLLNGLLLASHEWDHLQMMSIVKIECQHTGWHILKSYINKNFRPQLLMIRTVKIECNSIHCVSSRVQILYCNYYMEVCCNKWLNAPSSLT